MITRDTITAALDARGVDFLVVDEERGAFIYTDALVFAATPAGAWTCRKAAARFGRPLLTPQDLDAAIDQD